MHTPNKNMACLYNLFLFVCILQHSAEMKHPQNTEGPLSDKFLLVQLPLFIRTD